MDLAEPAHIVYLVHYYSDIHFKYSAINRPITFKNVSLMTEF